MNMPTATKGQVQKQDSVHTFTPEQVQLIKSQIMDPAATDDEMALFLYQATRTGLDPLAKQIYAVHRWNSAARRKTMTIQTSIDGYRLIAQRTNEMDGADGPFWCGEDGIWKDVWLESKPPTASKITVYRKGCDHGFTAVARFDDYAQTTKDGKLTQFWRRMASVMIAKVAESLALRRAFPAELSGVYTGEEMQQADQADPKATLPAQAKEKAPEPEEETQEPVEVTKKQAETSTKTCRICQKKIAKNAYIAVVQRGGDYRVAHWACYEESLGTSADPPEEETPEEETPASEPQDAPAETSTQDDDLPW